MSRFTPPPDNGSEKIPQTQRTEKEKAVYLDVGGGSNYSPKILGKTL